MALNKLGLEYEHKTFGIRNRVERFFRYLKERTIVFHNKLSSRNYIEGIKNLNLFLNLSLENERKRLNSGLSTLIYIILPDSLRR